MGRRLSVWALLLLALAWTAACDEDKPQSPEEDAVDSAEVAPPDLSEVDPPEDVLPDTEDAVELPPEEVVDDADAVAEVAEVEEDLEPCVCGPTQVCGVLPCGTVCGGCPSDSICTEDFQCALRCTEEGFTGVAQWGKLSDAEEGKSFYYAMRNAEARPFDALVLELWTAGDGPKGPGTYELAYRSYKDCNPCLVLRQGVSDTGTARYLIPVSGRLEITAFGEEEDVFAATLHDVVLREVALFSSTAFMTFVLNGAVTCISELALETSTNLTKPYCVEAGTGNGMGDNIANFRLQNCLGEVVGLHDVCGKSKVMWLVATAAWCSACRQYVPGVMSTYERYKDDGMNVLFILGENSQGGKPTLAQCVNYASQNKLPPELVLIDYGNTWGGFETLFTYLNPYITGNTFGLPWNAVLDGRSMIYVYADEAAPSFYAKLTDALGALLSQD